MKTQKRKNKFFDEIMAGLNDALEHTKGNKKLKTTIVKIHPVQDMSAKEISKLREKLCFSQAIFAEFLGVSKKNSRILGIWKKSSKRCGTSFIKLD